MELTLYRSVKHKDYTEGRLLVQGQYLCDTLEPTWRDVGWGRKGRKVPGRTAIPAGRYAVAITLSPKFKRWLPLLLHVPLFEGIRIHEGNAAQDTAGCILVGKRCHEGMLVESRLMLHRLLEILNHRPLGEPIWITVTDDARPLAPKV